MSIGTGTHDSKARIMRHDLGERKGSSAGSREVEYMRMTGAHRRVPGTETRGVAMAFPGNETHPDCLSATARTIRNVKNI
jgi:hypothetical protein